MGSQGCICREIDEDFAAEMSVSEACTELVAPVIQHHVFRSIGSLVSSQANSMESVGLSIYQILGDSRSKSPLYESDLSYEKPTIITVDMYTPSSTRGGTIFTVSGIHFGPKISASLVKVFYGRRSSNTSALLPYMGSHCKRATRDPHISANEIECQTSPGTGSGVLLESSSW